VDAELEISTDPARLDIDLIHRWMAIQDPDSDARVV
jgi:hypothetical protein